MPAARELTGELSAHAEAALRRGLDKTPEERFPTACQFVAALTPAAWPGRNGQPAQGDTDPAPVAERATSSGRPSVLVVDDGEANRELIEACLAEVDCEVRLAADGPAALRAMDAGLPDLVLLDVQMPGMDGYEVCRRIRTDPERRLIPVVMITALAHTEDRVRALESGADDFMSKPVERVELVARVKSALRMRALYTRLDSAEQVIFALAAAVEAKDAATEKHTHRVAETARYIGSQLGLPEVALDALYRGGIIHDIGKIGVSESVLLKAGPLDSLELARMRAHPAIGESIVGPLRSGSSLLPIIRHHHERYDGTGYPDGLHGEEIPLLARIISVCDAFDAMVNDRPYRTRLSVEDAIANLRAGAGTQWDPELVDLFVREVAAIQRVSAA
jgi:putative two-component system response regulator